MRAKKLPVWLLPCLTILWIIGVHIGPRLSATNPLHTIFAMLPEPILILPQAICGLILIRRALAKKNPILSWIGALASISACFGIVNLNSPKPKPPEGGIKIRALTLNVHLGSRDVPEALRFIREDKIDLVFLQENFGGADSPASNLKSSLPGWNLATSEGVAILSRFPMTKTKSIDLNSSIFHALLSTELDVAGTRIRAIGVHWSAPQSAKSWNPIRQAGLNKHDELNQTLKLLAESKHPTVMAGDFNTPPRHHAIRALENELESCFKARGSGTGWTYPNNLPMIQLDHMFVSGGIRTLVSRVTQKLGSDHRGLVCELSID